MPNSTHTLVCALMPEICRGCDNPVKDSYINNKPLPIIRRHPLRNTSTSIRNSTNVQNVPVGYKTAYRHNCIRNYNNS